MRRFWAALLLAMLLAAARADAAARPKKNDHYRKGRSAFSIGQWKEAARELNLAVGQSPGFKDAWYLLGIAEYQLGHYRRAEKAELRVTVIDSRDYNAWTWLANTALAQGHYDGARKYARDIFKFDQRSFLAYYLLGVIDYTQGRIGPAHEDWDRSRSVWDEYAPTLFNLGVAEYNMHSPQKAMERMRAAILQDSHDPKYQFVLGWYAFQYHDLGTAFVNFRRILENDLTKGSEYGDAARAFLALEQKDYTTATRDVDAALKKDPQFGQAWILKGMLLRRQGKKPEAEAAFREALALDTLDADARAQLKRMGVKPPPVGPARLPSAKPSPSPSPSPAAAPAPRKAAKKPLPPPPGAGPGVPVPAPAK